MDYMRDEQEQGFDYIVIGAGFSGTYCAGRLAEKGFRVAVVDKARGTGGRLSSKRLSFNDQFIGFDLGAHSFEVSNAKFETYVSGRDGVVIEENEKAQRAYAVSRNSSFARGALGDAIPFFGQRVLEARFEGAQWRLVLQGSEGQRSLRAMHCVLATPPKQAAQMLGEQHELFGRLDNVEHEAQWVVMFAMERDSEPVAALRHFSKQNVLQSAIIHKIAFDHDKQGRSTLDGLEIIVVHAQPQWTLRQVNAMPERVADLMLQELSLLTGTTVQELGEVVSAKHVHRWLYARPQVNHRLSGEYLSRDADNLLICGDYFTVDSDFGVESAFLSADALLAKEVG